MLDDTVLKSIRYVVDQQGHRSAVQMDLETWVALLSYLEDLEDREVLKGNLEKLKAGPEDSGAILWDKVKKEW